MPVYRYKAMTEQGQSISGEATAQSREDLRKMLSGKGYLVTDIRTDWLANFSGGKRQKRLSPEEFVVFVQELKALLRAGLSVPEALEIVADGAENTAFMSVIAQVTVDVNEGASLSQACQAHPDVFERMFISTLLTSEKTGDFIKPLEKYHSYLSQLLSLRKKVKQALSYPLFLLLILVVVIVVLFIFVMPRFVEMYSDLDAALPAPTQALIHVVDYLPFYLGGLLVPAFVIYAIVSFLGGQESGQRKLDALKERLPMVGEIYRVMSVAQLCRTLGSLVDSGMPLVSALESTVEALSNRKLAQRIQTVKDMVTEGKALSASMEQSNSLPRTAVKMIGVGERTGDLGGMLTEVAMFYEDRLDSYLTRIMSLTEPLLMLIIGVFLGGIIIVMYLPIFSMTEVIK